VSVTGAIMVAAGAVVGVTDFIIGRHFATMTPERAAETWKGRPVSIDQVHLMGKVLMFSAPVFFLLLSWVGLSGMAG